MAYDPTLMSMTPQQSPRSQPSIMGNQPFGGMPQVSTPMGGVANMVKALMDGNNQYRQQHLGLPSAGQTPGAPLSLAPPQDPTSPTDPTSMGGSLGSQMAMANPPSPMSMSGSPTPMPMPRPSGAPGMAGPTPEGNTMPMPLSGTGGPMTSLNQQPSSGSSAPIPPQMSMPGPMIGGTGAAPSSSVGGLGNAINGPSGAAPSSPYFGAGPQSSNPVVQSLMSLPVGQFSGGGFNG